MTTLLTVDETAARLHATPRQVYDLLRAGVIPKVKVGRLVRVDPEALEAWVKRGGARYADARDDG